MQQALFVATGLAICALTQKTAQGLEEPLFKAVSIKANGSDSLSWDWINRPDGGFSATNVRVSLLVARAYSESTPTDLAGMPVWTKNVRYDVIAISSLTRATRDDRAAMLRAMLAERFKLIAHVAKIEKPVYDLVVAREDRRLGPGLNKTKVDCDPSGGAEPGTEGFARSQVEPADVTMPRCALRLERGQLNGYAWMAQLGLTLRQLRYRLEKLGIE